MPSCCAISAVVADSTEHRRTAFTLNVWEYLRLGLTALMVNEYRSLLDEPRRQCAGVEELFQRSANAGQTS